MDSTISIANTSSFNTASTNSCKETPSSESILSAKMVVEPALCFSLSIRIIAKPDASVSKHPFLPHLQIISLSNTGMCPISPENPDLP